MRVYGTDHNQSILVNEVKLFTPAIDELTGKPVLNKRKESEHFIGIHCTNDE